MRSAAGVDPGVSRLGVFAVVVRSYLGHLVLGQPGGIPWRTVAVGTGVVVAVVYAAAVRRGVQRLFWVGVAAIGAAAVQPSGGPLR